jgi:signal transduction histidine kinase/CheY-like chemotaxis protein
MLPLSRSARALFTIAGLSLAAVVTLYAFPSHQRHTVLFATDLSSIWAATFAATCCFVAARRVTALEQRKTWRWIGAGCASYLVGQLAWTYYDLWVGTPPGYPSLADAGYLGIYLCLIVGVITLASGQPTRRADPELVLDTVLVTFTVGAVGYVYLLEPLLDGGPTESAGSLVTSIAWAIGGIAVLWLLLIQMLRRTVFSATTALLLLPGIIMLAVGNLIYAGVALRGTYVSGGPLDMTWDAGLLMIGAAAAIAPDQTRYVDTHGATKGTSGLAARVVALVVGLAGMAGLAIGAILHPEPGVDIAVIIGVGMVIIGARVLYSLGVDRRYAQLLEDEVANQTQSLMSSLGATASTERNLRLLMEAVPDAITVLDRDGCVLDENAAGRALVHAFPDSDGGSRRSGLRWLDATGARIASENLTAAFNGELWRFGVPFQRRTAAMAPVAFYAPVREGSHPQGPSLVRDIESGAPRRIPAGRSFAAMGQLVSGVAHEINNPAAIISGFAQTLLLDQLTPEQRETVQMMYDEATRIGRITSNLLAFARAGGKERSLVELNETVRRTYALRSYHLATLNISVKLELDDSNPKTWGNGSEMQQMLLNLLINAEQALTSGGDPVSGKRVITIRTTTAGEDRVRLQISDTGPGVPADLHEKIFDPFFTTKPEGAGSGLGLSICYGIVHDHGGRIWLEPDTSQGATFTVDLPRDARTRPRVIPPRPQTAVIEPRADEPALSVLLIDDEEGVRRTVLSFLTRRGMRVVAVGDGSDALRMLQRETFDVIVSDVRMPGMSGGEFLERLRVEYPAMVNRLVFTTGDTFAPDTAALLRESGVPSLVKPYDFGTLERVLREIAGG